MLFEGVKFIEKEEIEFRYKKELYKLLNIMWDDVGYYKILDVYD